MLHEERKAFFKKKPLASLVYDKGAFRCGGNCAKLKLFGTTGTAGGFQDTKKCGNRSYRTEKRKLQLSPNNLFIA